MARSDLSVVQLAISFEHLSEIQAQFFAKDLISGINLNHH